MLQIGSEGGEQIVNSYCASCDPPVSSDFKLRKGQEFQTLEDVKDLTTRIREKLGSIFEVGSLRRGG